MHVHILGICGTLMGSIALLARELGHEVSGSDENVYPPMSTQLAAAGIQLAHGYLPENIPADVDLVMIGNAGLPRGNAAVEYVLDRGLAYTSGAEWLGRYLLPDRWVIAVAGTHGKTTTTSMVAHILDYAGLSPGFLVGGIPANFSQSARLGSTPFFVIEADEYDTSYFDRRSKFLHYHPRTAILNNLEFDHADIFPDLAAIQAQFHLLVRTIPGSGLIIHPAEDANLDQVFARGCWTPRLTVSTSPAGNANITAVNQAADGSRFQVFVDAAPAGQVSWSQLGDHNVANALAAIAAARHVGVPPATACEALESFLGVKRRMEVIHADAGVTLYDDFAHHPSAIATTLKGLRHHVGNERILAIVEPRSHTMKRGTHADTLRDATIEADEVIWFQPEGVGFDMQAALLTNGSQVMDNTNDIIDAACRARENGVRHIVIMSNGGFENLHARLADRLTSLISE
ncbi:MAG: UDP-N-acetylmuramate:L-alanyl-gamma-D-glutamyl-meso-diaminopimelate ligase [Pseudomonadota bacterium]